jgi:hypothetical protein
MGRVGGGGLFESLSWRRLNEKSRGEGALYDTKAQGMVR